MKNKVCLLTGKITDRNFDGRPVDKEVLEFARRYRDAMKLKCVRGVLNSFYIMKSQFSYDWEGIKKKMVDELKQKNIPF